MPAPASPRFATTRWSLVLNAAAGDAPGARESLEALCAAYWYPLYAHARRRGRGPEPAQDLVQGFFARLLEREALAHANPERGRFRSFLLRSFENFLMNEAEREGALKRGGDRTHVSIGPDAESRFAREPAHEVTPERMFERDWAHSLLERVLSGLRAEYAARDQVALFERLKAVLVSEDARGWSAVAADLGMQEGAVRVAAHRLRARYRERLREAVADTLEDPLQVDVEIRSLFAAVERT